MDIVELKRSIQALRIPVSEFHSDEMKSILEQWNSTRADSLLARCDANEATRQEANATIEEILPTEYHARHKRCDVEAMAIPQSPIADWNEHPTRIDDAVADLIAAQERLRGELGTIAQRVRKQIGRVDGIDDERINGLIHSHADYVAAADKITKLDKTIEGLRKQRYRGQKKEPHNGRSPIDIAHLFLRKAAERLAGEPL